MPGPIYFAWVDPGTEFDPEVHNVTDEDVFGFRLTHDEGNFPMLNVQIVNPRIGLLNPSRKQWVWLSYDNGSEIVPLFLGRLIAIPQDLHNEVVSLDFRARPLDYDEQKETLAASMRALPEFDPLFISEEGRSLPDAVLEARPERWHIDRVTHVVTTSNILVGEDADFIVSGQFYDDMSVTHSEPPSRSINVVAQAVWRQKAAGNIDISHKFPTPIETYTGDGVIEDWPDNDTNIGNGWRVVETSVTNQNKYFSETFQGGTSVGLNSVVMSFNTSQGELLGFSIWSLVPMMVIGYEADREFAETVRFTLTADVQDLMTDPIEGEEIETLDYSVEVDAAIDLVGMEYLAPIRSTYARRYFQTARGKQSLEHLILRARANLLSRARAIEVQFKLPFEDGLELSCRRSATLTDPRLPNGEIEGKIISYTLEADGSSGELSCVVKIGCTIGNGGTVSENAGTPVYVDDVLEPGIQHYDGATEAVLANEVTYTAFDHLPINDDGVDFSNLNADNCLEGITVYNPASEQATYCTTFLGFQVNGEFDGWQQAIDKLNEAYTEIEVDTIDLNGGPFETIFDITVSELKVPKTIDLAAGAT